MWFNFKTYKEIKVYSMESYYLEIFSKFQQRSSSPLLSQPNPRGPEQDARIMFWCKPTDFDYHSPGGFSCSVCQMLAVLSRFNIQQEVIGWLLDLAVRLEYGNNAKKYKDSVPDNTKNAVSAAKNAERQCSVWM